LTLKRFETKIGQLVKRILSNLNAMPHDLFIVKRGAVGQVACTFSGHWVVVDGVMGVKP